MKLTLDKNFFIVQFLLVVVFYLINYVLLCDRSDKHHQIHFSRSDNKKAKVSGSELMQFVLALQFGIPSSALVPVSSEALFVTSLQRVLFVSLACAGIVFSSDKSEFALC